MKAIGLDFGTSNTAAAILTDDGEMKMLNLDPANVGDPRLLKSLCYFPTRKEAYFGKSAIDGYFERDMEGRFFQSIKKLLPNSDFQGTIIHGQHVSLEDLIARFLTETRKRIETEIGPIEGIPVVMGRPARYSNDPGREGLAVVRFRKACDAAGFQGCRLMEEPSAAARTYQASRSSRDELILVADLGGGTSDFTLMRFHGNKNTVLSVHGVSVAGDSLDSEFMTARLLPFFGSEIKYQRPFASNILTMPTSLMKMLPKWHHHAFLKEKSTWNFIKTLHKELVDPKQKPLLENLITLVEDNLGYALHQRVEALKCDLSGKPHSDFNYKSHPIEIEFSVQADEFESIVDPAVEAIKKSALETFKYAQVSPEQLDTIYFTGGTSQVPIIRKTLLSLFPNAKAAEKDTFTSVAAGLALSER